MATRPNPAALPASPPSGKPARQRFPVPWGLIIALAVYAVGVTGYIGLTYWLSPEYQASQHWAAAARVLGRNEGRGASREALIEAYEELLEAARLMPQVMALHKQLESLNWRFEERRFDLPRELRYRADAVAILAQRITTAQRPLLAVGARDRGWTPDELLEGPGQAARWSLVGALLLVVVWWFGSRRAMAALKEERRQALEREILEAGRYRDGLGTPERKPPRPGRKRGA